MREILPKNDASNTRGVSRSRVCEGITKRSQVSVACHGCRRRKVKCDNRRPKCTPCASSNQECYFPVSRLMRGINTEEMSCIGRRYQCMLTVFDLLRVAEGRQMEDLLKQIRGAESIDEFLDSVHEAALLMPLSRSNERENSNELNPNRHDREIHSRRDVSGVSDDTDQGRRNQD